MTRCYEPVCCHRLGNVFNDVGRFANVGATSL